MQNQNPHLESERKTLGTIAGQKMLTTIEKISFKKAFLFLAFGYFVARPESAIALLRSTMAANEYFLSKMAAAWFLLLYFYPICGVAKKLLKKIRAKILQREKSEAIEGVPIYEILHQLFYEGNFKREVVLKKWAIPQAKFDTIAKKLEALGVLVRGENNARILNPDFSREQTAEILREAGGSAAGIRSPLRILHFGRKLKPTGSEMRERVRIDVEEEPDREIPIRFGERSPTRPTNALDLRNA